MSTRPNLGGLFNGSTSPTRSSSIAGALKPRLVPIEIDGPAKAPINPPAAQESPSSVAPDWLDPMKALGSYFDLLQTLLDANRKLAEDWLGAVIALPQRVGLRRG
jgi:hypothetical protein